MDWIITRGHISDAEAIARFQVEMAAESEGTVLDFGAVIKGVTAALEDPAKGTYYIARNSEGAPVASLLLTREWSDWTNRWYWWIQSVYVSPEYRRRGVFSSLYDAVRQDAVKAGVTCLKLYVDKDNERAKTCYRKQGMSESHYLLYEAEI